MQKREAHLEHQERQGLDAVVMVHGPRQQRRHQGSSQWDRRLGGAVQQEVQRYDCHRADHLHPAESHTVGSNVFTNSHKSYTMLHLYYFDVAYEDDMHRYFNPPCRQVRDGTESAESRRLP